MAGVLRFEDAILANEGDIRFERARHRVRLLGAGAKAAALREGAYEHPLRPLHLPARPLHLYVQPARPSVTP